MLEPKQLIAEVAARNGIRVDEDDPAFCLVTMNQLVLEEAAREIADDIRAATENFERAAEEVQRRAGMALAQAQRDMLASVRSELQRANRRNIVLRDTANVLWGVGLFSAGLFVGMAMH